MITKFERKIIAGLMTGVICMSTMAVNTFPVYAAEEFAAEENMESFETDGSGIEIQAAEDSESGNTEVSLDEMQNSETSATNTQTAEQIVLKADGTMIRTETVSGGHYQLVPETDGEYFLNFPWEGYANVYRTDNGYELVENKNNVVTLQADATYNIDIYSYSGDGVTVKWDIGKIMDISPSENIETKIDEPGRVVRYHLVSEEKIFYTPYKRESFIRVYNGDSYLSSEYSELYWKLNNEEKCYVDIKLSDRSVTGIASTSITELATTIVTEDEKIHIPIENGEVSTFYEFVPEESGVYCLLRTDIVRQQDIYDSNWNRVMGNGDPVKLNMNAGESYYIKFGYVNEQFDWWITRADNITMTENVSYITELDQAIIYQYTPRKSAKYYYSIEDGEGECRVYDESWNYRNSIYGESGIGMTLDLQQGETYYFNISAETERIKWRVTCIEESGEYTYQILPDDTVEILGYVGTDKSITTPETIAGKKVSSIGYRAFADNVTLEEVIIPDDITRIGEQSFYRDSSLKKVVIGNGLAHIADSAFNRCGLVDITIGNKVQSIGMYSFYSNENLERVIIPNSVTKIEYKAFEGCTELQDIVIPDSVEKIEDRAFNLTAWLDNQAEGDVYAGKVYYKYKGGMPENTVITIKEGTKGIAGGAVWSQVGLTEVNIPEGVTNIGAFAFLNCESMKEITIPGSVTEIGEGAFGYLDLYLSDKVDGFTIRGLAGSAAQKYAEKNGFNFIVEEPDYMKGDVNGNGEVDIADCRTALRSVCKKVELTESQKLAADVEEDGIVDIKDIRKILRYICKKIEEL